jgi:hypothetical protein
LITSAPKSARSLVAYGPASIQEKSKTLIPFSIPLTINAPYLHFKAILTNPNIPIKSSKPRSHVKTWGAG